MYELATNGKEDNFANLILSDVAELERKQFQLACFVYVFEVA